MQTKKECVHNFITIGKGNPYLSFGPSAHGFNNNIRYWNTRDLNKYMENLNKNNLPDSESEALTQENIFNELILNSLRLERGIAILQIKNNFNIETNQNILTKPKSGERTLL